MIIINFYTHTTKNILDVESIRTLITCTDVINQHDIVYIMHHSKNGHNVIGSKRGPSTDQTPPSTPDPTRSVTVSMVKT